MKRQPVYRVGKIGIKLELNEKKKNARGKQNIKDIDFSPPENGHPTYFDIISEAGGINRIEWISFSVKSTFKSPYQKGTLIRFYRIFFPLRAEF